MSSAMKPTHKEKNRQQWAQTWRKETTDDDQAAATMHILDAYRKTKYCDLKNARRRRGYNLTERLCGAIARFERELVVNE